MAELIPAVPVNYEPVKVPAGTPVGQALREKELPNKGPEAVVVVRGEDGTLYDLSHIPARGCHVYPSCSKRGGRPRRHPPLLRTRHGAGRPSRVPGHQAGHRSRH